MPSGDSYAALRSPHSNVWNVRAPYARYLEMHKQLNKDHQLRQITLDRMKTELRNFPLEQQVTEGMLNSLYGRSHRIAVRRYGQQAQTVKDMLNDLERQYHESNKDTLQEISTLFEQFAICWCANMLLATLENKQSLSEDQKDLVVPIARDGTTPRPKEQASGGYQNGISQIVGAFSQFYQTLASVPRRKTNPKTRQPEATVSNEERGALRMVGFWKVVRNQIVHKNSVVDRGFIRRWSTIWDLLRSDLHGIPPLLVDASIPLRPAHVAASFTTHDLLAKGMRDVLVRYSNERRGHVFSPGPFRGAMDPEEMPDTLPALFVYGDWSYSRAKIKR